MLDRSRVSDWLVSFSLANLVFLRCWEELLSPEQNRIYWLKNSPAPAHYVSLVIDILILGALFYALIGAIRKKRPFARRAMMLFGLLVLVSLVNSLRTLISNPGTSLFLRFVEQRAPVIGVVAAILLVGALVFGGVRALRPVYRLYNNPPTLAAVNHRFTADGATYAAMRAMGWIGEGVAFCAP